MAPLRTLKFVVAYDGAGFHGWQRQPGVRTVQETVQDVAQRVLNHPLSIIGASRTDAGVHARGQVAHLDLDREFACSALVHGTNHRLPADIRVLAAEPAAPDFHARFSASGKEYRYRLSRAAVLTPFDEPFVVRVEGGLDVDALGAGAALLVGRHDFTAFALAGGAHREPERTITAAEWSERGEELVFRVAGDGFLRGMVRGLVGTLLEVGAGRRPVESLAALLQGRARGEAGPTAPARGLILERVFYPW